MSETNRQNTKLTKKRRAAIYAYVVEHTVGGSITSVIDATLKADRMPPDELYTWLKNRRYKWNPKISFWVKTSQGATT